MLYLSISIGEKLVGQRLIVFSKFPNIFIMPRKCLNHPDRFFFVCENFTSKEQQRNINHDIKKVQMIYFGCSLGDQDTT